nr:LysR family transcriptional regulator [Salipiger thiooxidans]
MNLPASTLNRRIRGFEAEFDSAIFERIPGGVRPNPAATIRPLRSVGA